MVRSTTQRFLCTSMAAGIAAHIPRIDAVITYDLPWVKVGESAPPESLHDITQTLREGQFDTAVIFTMYSQNPAPSMLLAWLAGIPRRLAYSRENPYGLLTDWLPDEEAYTFIRHQVARDLALVESVSAKTENKALSLQISPNAWQQASVVLEETGVDTQKPWLLLHAGVSEAKRAYPEEAWVTVAQKLSSEMGYQVLFTGGKSEAVLTESLAAQVGEGAFSLGGKLPLEDFMALIQKTPLLLTVNSGPAHLAAAFKTPVVVLYALTNPQHLPWQKTGKALFYSVPCPLRSRNEVVRFVQESLQPQDVPVPAPETVLSAVNEVLSGKCGQIPELAPLRSVSFPSRCKESCNMLRRETAVRRPKTEWAACRA